MEEKIVKENIKEIVKENMQDKLKKLTEELERTVQQFMSGEKYMAFLSSMAKFHKFSLNNQILIAMQKKDATLCASYGAWKKNFGRYVKKGEEGIRIICPAPFKKKISRKVIDEKTGKPELMEDGSFKKEIVEETVMRYTVGYVWDISQTSGEPLPEIVQPLDGDLDDDLKKVKKAILQICPVPVSFKPIVGETFGYYKTDTKEIVVDSTISEKDSLTTIIHEMAHAIMHNADAPGYKLSSMTKEVQAESVCYIVSKYFGLDTSQFSFGYIADWSSTKETPELKESLEAIRNTANDIIAKVEKIL